jgi:hypothetical protein
VVPDARIILVRRVLSASLVKISRVMRSRSIGQIGELVH